MTTATKTGVTTFATPNDQELSLTRVLDAPRRLVFDAWTNPGTCRSGCSVRKAGPCRSARSTCAPGGSWRYVWRKADGTEMAMGGIDPRGEAARAAGHDRAVGPRVAGDDQHPRLTESGGRTTITLTVRYPSKDARDAALKTGMKDGMDPSFARLDKLLRTLA